jgi:hypothetical protein
MYWVQRGMRRMIVRGLRVGSMSFGMPWREREDAGHC